jgi:hypothetical protein
MNRKENPSSGTGLIAERITATLLLIICIAAAVLA